MEGKRKEEKEKNFKLPLLVYFLLKKVYDMLLFGATKAIILLGISDLEL